MLDTSFHFIVYKLMKITINCIIYINIILLSLWFDLHTSNNTEYSTNSTNKIQAIRNDHTNRAQIEYNFWNMSKNIECFRSNDYLKQIPASTF